jgi:hypothetical protein
MCHSNPQQGTPPCVSASHVTQGANPRNLEVQMRGWICGRHQNKYYDTYSLPLKLLYSISGSYKTEYSTPQIIFLTQHECSSIPNTSWLFLAKFVAAQLCNSPSLLSKNYSWFLPNNKFSGGHSIEAENFWSLKVMPVHRQFTFLNTHSQAIFRIAFLHLVLHGLFFYQSTPVYYILPLTVLISLSLVKI